MTHPKKIAQVGMWLCVGFILATLYALIVENNFNEYRQLVTACVVAALGLCLSAVDWYKYRNAGVFYGHTKLFHLRSFRWPQFHFYGGTPAMYKQYFEPSAEHREYIALVACTLKNGNIYAVERPGRHSHVQHMLRDQSIPLDDEDDQGFVTSLGRYVSRTEAVIIAGSAGQITFKGNPLNQLFSEDLWSTPASHYHMATTTDFQNEWKRDAILRGQPALEDIKVMDPALRDAPKEIIEDQPVVSTPSVIVNPEFPMSQVRELTKGTLGVKEIQNIAKTAEEYCVTLDEHVVRATGRQHTGVYPWVNDGWQKIRDHEEGVAYMKKLVTFANARRELKANQIWSQRPDHLLRCTEEVQAMLQQVIGEDVQVNCDLIKRMALKLIDFATDEGVNLSIEVLPGRRSGEVNYMRTTTWPMHEKKEQKAIA